MPPPSRPAGRADGGGLRDSRRALRVVALVLVPGAAAAFAAVAATGAASPSPFADPGAGVRWGLPLTRLVADLAEGLALGLLLLAATVPATAGGEDPGSRRVHPAARHAACAAAVVWALAALARLVLGYAAGTGQGLGDPSLGTQLQSYVTQVDAGREAAAGVVGAGLVATLAAGITRRGGAAAVAVLAVAVLGAQSLADTAGTPGDTVLTAVLLWLHAVGAAVVVGGIGGLLLVAPASGAGLGALAGRLARPAAAALALVGVSGLAAAGLRLSARRGMPVTWSLVAVKAVALAALGVLIWRALRPATTGATSGAARVGAACLAAVAVGIGVALALGG